MGVTEKDRGRNIVAGSPVVIPISVQGTLATGNGKAHFKNALFPFTVKQIVMHLQTLHSTSTGGVGEIIQVRNATDTADLMDTADRGQFSDTAGTDNNLVVVAEADLQNNVIAVDDVIAIDVDDVDSGASAADLTVWLIGERNV